MGINKNLDVMKTNSLIFLLFISLFSCDNKKTVITHFEDYESYLGPAKLTSKDPLKEELKFWEERLDKNKSDETSLVKLGAIHAQLFKSTGLAKHILISDSLYMDVLKNYPEGNVEIYHSLATNAITQHKFQKAKNYAEKALALKDKKATSLLILVDVSLEIGDYARANLILRDFKNKNSFAYLIRNAKVKDHEGFLDSAIVNMEKAYRRIKGNKDLSQWALSNLADMYGHAGRIEESYALYLEVLKDNPHDDYALKGIAWIALSHDLNTKAAKTIVNELAVRKHMPESHLMLAEIAELNGNEMEKASQFKKFKSLVSSPEYKSMYHKYLATAEAEEFNNPAAAVAIAHEEIVNRPTPQSYDLLAWGYYHQKKFHEALSIATRQVENQTFEPEAFYHLGIIYEANGNTEKAQYYLSAALESEFELGPSISRKIKVALKNL
jgi:tetratricopeptide (TPR) repeat protein